MLKHLTVAAVGFLMVTGQASTIEIRKKQAVITKVTTEEFLESLQQDAKRGNVAAQLNLAIMYSRGLSVPQDYAEAARWFRMAAEQGDVFGQYRLGEVYREGRGVPQDYVVAHMWYNLAASSGHAAARFTRDYIGRRMTPDQIAEAQRLAREWMAERQ